jgi:hypothetical protein
LSIGKTHQGALEIKDGPLEAFGRHKEKEKKRDFDASRY